MAPAAVAALSSSPTPAGLVKVTVRLPGPPNRRFWIGLTPAPDGTPTYAYTALEADSVVVVPGSPFTVMPACTAVIVAVPSLKPAACTVTTEVTDWVRPSSPCT